MHVYVYNEETPTCSEKLYYICGLSSRKIMIN